MSELKERLSDYKKKLPILYPEQVPTCVVFDMLDKLQEDTENDKDALEIYVTNILRGIGIPASIKGYWFLRDAIIMCAKDIKKLDCIINVVYTDVSKEWDSTPSRVERAIRHAIERTWEKGNKEAIGRLFKYSVDPDRGKPTNSEFIALIVDKVRLEFM